MGRGRENLAHAFKNCDDPDCEIHNPEVIEDESQRLTALAWFYVGAHAGATQLSDRDDDVLSDMRDDLMVTARMSHQDDTA